MTIVPIVEGHGEVRAVPKLLHKIAVELALPDIKVEAPVRSLPDKVKSKDSELQRMIFLAAAKLGSRPGFILLMFDSDDCCPAEESQRLKQRAREVHPEVPLMVALLQREYETIFLYAAASLGLGGGSHPVPLEPTSVRGAKELIRKMRGSYRVTEDQLALTQAMNMKEALRCPSLRRLADRIVEFSSRLGSQPEHD